MSDSAAPWCMDRITIHKGREAVELSFVPSDDPLWSGKIPLTTVRLLGIDLKVAADVAYPHPDCLEPQRDTRLDLYLEKNGEPFRLICYGGLLLCDEVPSSKSDPEKFRIQFGSWE